MSSKITRAMYEKLIEENIAAMEASNMAKLEKEHTQQVLRHSIVTNYDVVWKLQDLERQARTNGFVTTAETLRQILTLIDGERIPA